MTEIRTATETYRATATGFDGAGLDLAMALEIAALAGDQSDPLDQALIAAASAAGFDRDTLRMISPQIAQWRDVSGRGYAATFHSPGPRGPVTGCVRGTPERVLALCDRYLTRNGSSPLDETTRAACRAANRLMARSGLRVVAVAIGRVPSANQPELTGLRFAGLIGVLDPPAPDVAEAIDACHVAGVRTVLLTTDQPDAAVTFAAQVGLEHSPALALDDEVVEQMREDDLQAQLGRINVVSRATPQTIRRVVAGLRQRGEVVALVGDRVASAATLRISPSEPLGAPRTLAEMVEKIRAGRVRIDNGRKLVFYLVSCGVAGTLLFLGLRAAGLPMAWRQGLWLALVTSVLPALALTREPAQPDVMRRPPMTLWDGLLAPSFVRACALSAGALTFATLLAVAWSLVAPLPPGRTATLVFLTLGVAQLLHLGNARDRAAVLRPRRIVANPVALLVVAAVALLQVLAVTQEPLRTWLQLAAMAPSDWALAVAAGAAPAIAGQAVKLWRATSNGQTMNAWRQLPS